MDGGPYSRDRNPGAAAGGDVVFFPDFGEKPHRFLSRAMGRSDLLHAEVLESLDDPVQGRIGV